ncbi:MAG: M23 family metallopeptidase [Sphaerochaetaceae bacterium]|nr:M23 family metallopeptidase [Sphaerochaetaceae bacterium]
MARRNYDDYTEKRVSNNNSSSKLLFVVILISILICAVAVLCWVKILETQDIVSAKVDEVVPKEESVEIVQVEKPSVSLNIDDGISYAQTASDFINYLSSSYYVNTQDLGDSELTEQSVEMKKPLIAQSLSISQQSAFSKNLVKYQEYKIKEGDSLVSIAQEFGINYQTIISINQIKSASSLFIGSTIQIPDRDGSLYIVKDGDSLFSITQQYGLAISAKTLGDINGILEDNLTVGQKLFIPSENIETQGTITANEEVRFANPAYGTVVGMYNHKVASPVTEGSVILDGILIQALEDYSVYAIADGSVVDKGFNEDGSSFIKIHHGNGYSS